MSRLNAELIFPCPIHFQHSVRDNSQHSAAAAAAAADNTFVESEETNSSQPSAENASVDKEREADSLDFESLVEIETISNRSVKVSTPLQNCKHTLYIWRNWALFLKFKRRTYFLLFYSLSNTVL